MTDRDALPSADTASPTGLLSRVVGIIFSPRATYARIAARPRVVGALVLVLAISAAASFTFMSTEIGKAALIDQQVRTMESFGQQVPDAAYARLEAMSQYAPYVTVAYLAVFFPIGALILSGLLIAIFNAAFGGQASFKQVYAVVVHSFFVIALQQLFAYPLDYAKESLSSPTNLAVFTPFLDEGSFLARLFGSIDLFVMWWVLSLAIGVAVLYKKRTTPIATTMLIVYGAIAILIAAVRTALSGA